MIDMFMVRAMFARPHQSGIFECAGAENEREKADRPAGLECDVREKAMITEANAEPRRREHDEEKRDLKTIQSELPEVPRDGGEREDECADEEGTCRPVDALNREMANEPAKWRCRSWLGRDRGRLLANRRFYHP